MSIYGDRKFHLVSYDVNSPPRDADYQMLYAEFAKLKGVRLQASLWEVATTLTEPELHSHLSKFLDGNDSLMVNEKSPTAVISNPKQRPSGPMAGIGFPPPKTKQMGIMGRSSSTMYSDKSILATRRSDR
jgi:hypothetical protein